MDASLLVASAVLGAGAGWLAAWRLSRARVERRMRELGTSTASERTALQRDLRAAEKLAASLREEVARQSKTIHRLDGQIAQGMTKIVEVERSLAIRNADMGELRAAYDNLSGELTQTRARLWEREERMPSLARGTGDDLLRPPPSLAPKKVQTEIPTGRQVIVPPRKKL